MSFLYPLFLVGLAAVALPILLHLFRRRTEAVVEFPAVRLLENVPVEQQRKRRLRELILLALRVTALGLLAFAFARPYVASNTVAAPSPITVIALDQSLSMSAPGQWERARQAARQAVRAVPSTHSVALVAFADAATLLVPATTDRGRIDAAIEQAEPTAGGTRYRTALARSAEAITSGQGGIVVITDLQQAGWEASDEGAVPDGIEVKVIDVAAPVNNVAITNARREGGAVIAAIHNFGKRPARVTVRLRIADRDLTNEVLDVAAQSAADVRFAAQLPVRGGAEVRIDDRDGYSGDNVRYVILDPASALPIFIITSQPPGSSNAGLYVERAVSVADDGRAFAPRVVDGRAFSTLPAAEFINEAAGVVLLGTTTLDRAGRERIASFLRSGGRVLATLGPDVDLATLDDTLGVAIPVDAEVDAKESSQRTVTFIAADMRHPILRPFAGGTGALGAVYIERYRRLNLHGPTTALGGANVLATFSGGDPALIERSVDKGRLLVFASDLDNRWNRFPIVPAFVPWMIETARYLSEGRDERQTFTLPNVPSGVPPRVGVHQIGTRLVAVNPDVRESNPERTTLEEFQAAIARSTEVAAARTALAVREQEEKQRLWQIGLLAMFVALASEGLIGRRAM